MANLDAVLQEIDGGVYDLKIGFDGDLETADFFDTSLVVSILSDKRANSSEILDSSKRRGWIGNEVRDDGFELGSKLWIYEQSRLTRTVMNSIEDVVREALQWMVDDGFAVSIRSVRVEPLPPSSPVVGIGVTVAILRPQSEVVTRFFNLWTDTGVASLLEEPPIEGEMEPPFATSFVSVDFDGTLAEELGSATGVPLEIGNAFTAAIWWKPRAANYSAGLASNVWGMREEAGGALQNRLQLSLLGATANDPLQVSLHDSGGTLFKNYRYDSASTPDAWNFSLFTWDGTNLVFYHDGSLVAPTFQSPDLGGTMTDTDRIVKMAQADGSTDGLDGLIHSIGLWDVVLGDAAQQVLYNGGNGRVVDWKQNDGAYVAGPNLKHWWRPGLDSGNIGQDYGRASSLIDAAEAAVGIDASDVVTDSPGV